MFEKKSPPTIKDKKNLSLDYKDPVTLYHFLEGAKITPARNNGLTNKQQRQLRNAIKKARNLALIPTHYQSYDEFGRPELLSIKAFKYK